MSLHMRLRLLMVRFRSFGPLRYARITIDKATGRSRGTGFVCFWNTEHADAAIEEAQKVASETGANAMPVSCDELLFTKIDANNAAWRIKQPFCFAVGAHCRPVVVAGEPSGYPRADA